VGRRRRGHRHRLRAGDGVGRAIYRGSETKQKPPHDYESSGGSKKELAMSILGTPTKIINGIPVEDPEPDFDWDTFAAHNPDFSHEIDESFTDGGTGGDLMSAMSRVADYTCAARNTTKR
jgi:hypothetical protein